VKKGDELSGGKYIAVPTIADLVERAGAHSVMAAAKECRPFCWIDNSASALYLHTTASRQTGRGKLLRRSTTA